LGLHQNQWELASRGGLEQKQFPWGDDLTPGGAHMCNIWQGTFPNDDLGEDGYTTVAPVQTFPPNGFGLHHMVGNAWDWCADYYQADWHVEASRMNPAGPATGTPRLLKGGSFLRHESYCRRYRNAARIGNTPDTSTSHIGFRVVRDIG
jgi:formylglycine-generating enzyme required for sulfatase activity